MQLIISIWSNRWIIEIWATKWLSKIKAGHFWSRLRLKKEEKRKWTGANVYKMYDEVRWHWSLKRLILINKFLKQLTWVGENTQLSYRQMKMIIKNLNDLSYVPIINSHSYHLNQIRNKMLNNKFILHSKLETLNHHCFSYSALQLCNSAPTR